MEIRRKKPVINSNIPNTDISLVDTAVTETSAVMVPVLHKLPLVRQCATSVVAVS